MRPWWTLCALLILASLARADAPKEAVTVIKLTVDARPAPKPALKYLLLPDLKDMRQGNAVLAYYKCFLEQNRLYHGKEEVANREKWLNCPLAELPDNLTDYGGSSARQAEYAARLDGCDWQILERLRDDGISLLLPDVQELRMLAQVLKVRYRGQVKARKFDDAIRTHQTMFALCRHLGEHPTLIGNLVGIAIGNIALGPYEEMIQQPGCPSFYWALAHLPHPLMDVRKSLAGERMFIFNAGDWGGAMVDPDRVWNDDDVRKAHELARRMKGLLDYPKKDDTQKVEKWILEKLKDEAWLASARKSLVEEGLAEAKVKRFPPEQVVFNYLRIKYETSRDEGMKWATLPFWQSDEALMKLGTRPDDPAVEQMVVTALGPAMHKVRRAGARFEQRLALLMVVEALRLHAAENGGKLPASLNDLKVPAPADPISGKAFGYKLDGGAAIVLGAAPKGEEKNAHFNVRYELTIRK